MIKTLWLCKTRGAIHYVLEQDPGELDGCDFRAHAKLASRLIPDSVWDSMEPHSKRMYQILVPESAAEADLITALTNGHIVQIQTDRGRGEEDRILVQLELQRHAPVPVACEYCAGRDLPDRTEIAVYGGGYAVECRRCKQCGPAKAAKKYGIAAWNTQQAAIDFLKQNREDV